MNEQTNDRMNVWMYERNEWNYEKAAIAVQFFFQTNELGGSSF